MIRCSASLIIKEIIIRTAMSYYFIPIRIGIIKGSTKNNSWRVYGEKGALLHYWCM